MATRFYFNDNVFWDNGGSNPANPTYHASWTETNSALKVKALVTKPGIAFSQMTIQKNVATNPTYGLHRVYVSDPLPSGVTVSGTVRGQFLCQEQNAANDAGRAMIIRVCNGDCTVFRTPEVLVHLPASLVSEYNDVTAQNRSFPPVVVINDVVALAGDRIVIEVGTAYYTGASGAGTTATVRTGNPLASGDLPVDEAYTIPELAGWVEFSQDLFANTPDPFLLTLSGPLNSRLAAPSKRGLHFVNIEPATRTHYFWDGSLWQRLFEESLAPATDRARLLTLTDTAQGPTLTPGTIWAGPDLCFFGPGGTQSIRAGGAGHMALGGTAVGSLVVLDIQKLNPGFEFNSASGIVGIRANVKNIGTGAPTAMTFIANIGGGTTTGFPGGCNGVVNTSNVANTGDLFGFRGVIQMTAAAAHANLAVFRAQAPSISAAGSATRYTGFEFSSGNSTLWTLPTLTGFDVLTLQAGTSRTGFKCAGASSGSPSFVAGLDVGAHSVGADRYGVRVANKIVNLITSFLADTFGEGYISKDGQGTPHYWKQAISAGGIPYFTDIGTAAPVT